MPKMVNIPMPIPLELVVRMDERGAVTVSGPIDQKMICLGLLEIAKQSVHAYQATQQPLVQPATLDLGAADIDRILKGNGHG